MLYSLDNVTVSMFNNMATFLRAQGWNIYWHASGNLDAFTAGPEKGTISLVSDTPENPVFINSAGDRTQQDQIVLPAFAIQVQLPRKQARLGLGHVDFERDIDVKIGGIARNSREQSTLASALYEWLEIGDVNYYMPMWNYSNPALPVALDPAEVWWADVSTLEVANEVGSIRYQINIELILRIVE